MALKPFYNKKGHLGMTRAEVKKALLDGSKVSPQFYTDNFQVFWAKTIKEIEVTGGAYGCIIKDYPVLFAEKPDDLEARSYIKQAEPFTIELSETDAISLLMGNSITLSMSNIDINAGDFLSLFDYSNIYAPVTVYYYSNDGSVLWACNFNQMPKPEFATSDTIYYLGASADALGVVVPYLMTLIVNGNDQTGLIDTLTIKINKVTV